MNGKVLGRPKPDRVYSPEEKRIEHPNEITDLMEVVGNVPNERSWPCGYIQVFKAPNKLRKSENYWRVNRGGGYGLELPILRAVVSPPDATPRKGFYLFRNVASGGGATAGRAGATLRVHFTRGNVFM